MTDTNWEFAAKSHHATVEAQHRRIAELEKQLAALSQPILSAVVASDEPTELSPSAERGVEYIMAAVQEFASAWSLVGGRFDNGSMLEQAEAYKARIKRMLEDDARKLVDALASAPAQPVAAIPEEDNLWPKRIRAALKSAELGMGSYGQKYDGAQLAYALKAELDAADTLPAIPEAGQSVPEALFDGYAVLKALKPREAAFVSPEAVSAVLDAAVRLIRATPSPAVHQHHWESFWSSVTNGTDYRCDCGAVQSTTAPAVQAGTAQGSEP